MERHVQHHAFEMINDSASEAKKLFKDMGQKLETEMNRYMDEFRAHVASQYDSILGNALEAGEEPMSAVPQKRRKIKKGKQSDRMTEHFEKLATFEKEGICDFDAIICFFGALGTFRKIKHVQLEFGVLSDFTHFEPLMDGWKNTIL